MLSHLALDLINWCWKDISLPGKLEKVQLHHLVDMFMFGPWNKVALASSGNHVECRFLSKWSNDLEGQGQWPPFSIPTESIPGCMFGVNLVILAQIYDELSRGQAKIPRILSQNGQNDLEDQIDDLYFQYHPWVSHDACLVLIWWFQLKSVKSYRADKVKFTDRQTDRRRQRQFPFSLKGPGVKIIKLECYSPCNMSLKIVIYIT